MRLMTLVTTNIRFDNPEDGKNRWPNRRERYCRLIQQLGGDVIATQEGWRSQLSDIDARLSMHTLVDNHRSWIEERMYPCLFVNQSKLEIEMAGDVWLSETPDVAGSVSFGSNFPRLMTWARVRDRSSGALYLVANFHLDNSTEEIRERQLRVGLERLADVAVSGDHVILMGDFNSAPTGRVYHLACDASLHLQHRYDPWITAGLKERGTYHGFQGPGFSYDRIDWILLDERLSFETIECSLANERGELPSDHFPLVCTGVTPTGESSSSESEDT